MADQQDDFSAVLNDSGEPTLERAIAKAREVVDMLENVTLNIAVTGESGAGKSSFVNAIRDVKETEEGAAPTDVNECTMEPTMYPHPNFPNVNLWDLPGIGSPTFKAETYINDVKYQNYDFFIIVSAGRFRQNDMMLANEINKKKKKFYFVRTKIDIDVANNKRKNVDEKETLEKIRKNYLENLSTFGSPPVFLISSYFLKSFDFHKLVKQLSDDLPDHKRNALVMSLPVYSMKSLYMKYNQIQQLVWAVALISGGGIGVATGCDVARVVSFLTKCYYSFGLDKLFKPWLEDESGLVTEIANNKPLTMVASLGVAGVIQALNFFVPGAGNIAAAVVSVGTIRSALLGGISELFSVAKRLIT